MAQTAVEWLIKTYQQTNKIDNFDLEVAKEMENEQRGYTKQEFLNAAQLGEVSMIDARHIVSLLDEARDLNNK